MTLKEQMEYIWNRPGVMYPSNTNWWTWQDAEYWWEGKIGPMRKVMVCLKGRRQTIKGPKPKSKGFSNLSRNYFLYWSAQKLER